MEFTAECQCSQKLAHHPTSHVACVFSATADTGRRGFGKCKKKGKNFSTANSVLADCVSAILRPQEPQAEAK